MLRRHVRSAGSLNLKDGSETMSRKPRGRPPKSGVTPQPAMPPAISDDEIESDDGPDMVPAKAPKEDVAEDVEDDEDDDEQNEDEDEYRVEKILAHGHGKGGVVIYHIKWLGYDDEEDLTWEPIENLENAPDLLKKYHNSIGGKPEPKGKKKGGKGDKRTASAAFTESPAVEASAKKRGRKPAGDTNGTPKGKELPEGSWENEVSRVTSIIEETNPAAVKGVQGRTKNLLGLLEWNTGRKTQHPLDTLRRKCPQRLLDYYEQHLVFKTGGDDTDS